MFSVPSDVGSNDLSVKRHSTSKCCFGLINIGTTEYICGLAKTILCYLLYCNSKIIYYNKHFKIVLDMVMTRLKIETS